jgi:integral membrane protein
MNKEISKNVLNTFRIVAFCEGCSYLLLFITMPIKYYLKIPMPNYIVGMLHGFLFISYIILLLLVSYKYKWSFVKMCLAFVVSLIPFGTFWADKKIFNSNKTINIKA